MKLVERLSYLCTPPKLYHRGVFIQRSICAFVDRRGVSSRNPSRPRLSQVDPHDVYSRSAAIIVMAAAFGPAALEDSTRERDPSDPLNIIGVGTETPGRTERGGSEVGVDLIGRAWNMYAETTP